MDEYILIQADVFVNIIYGDLMKKYLKTSFIIFLCGCIFFAGAYFYLNKNLESKNKAADTKKEDIPYSEVPENCGLHFLLPANREVLFFLDFEEKISYIINIYEKANYRSGYAGYSFDYTFTVDYSVLSALIDRIGGLDLISGEETLRFTGIQVCDCLCTNGSPEFYYEVTNSFCDRLAQNGFSGEDFVFLIENTETGLTVPVCLYWQEYIKDMFANAVFVNWVI